MKADLMDAARLTPTLRRRRIAKAHHLLAPIARIAHVVATLGVATALLGGCSSSSADSTSPGATPTGDDAGADAGPLRSEACVAQDTALQAALDKARGKASPNAALAVKNEACGTAVYVSGDPKSETADALFRVGSITKTFVSAAILTLVKGGKVSLDDPLSKWVQDVPNTDGVTVRMLMNHTSGIFNFTETPGFGSSADLVKKWTPRELVDLATKSAPYFAPGKGWHYSNTNYVLVGMIAEQASGKKLGALIRERALVPAGLTHTFFDGEEPVEGTRAKAFSGAFDVTHYGDPSMVWASGAMLASPEDVATWFTALYSTDTVLDADTRALLTKDPIAAGQGLSYGLGVTILNNLTSKGAGTAYGHDGDIPGFHCAGFYYLDKKTTVVSFVNQDGANPYTALYAATQVLFKN